MTSPRVRVLSGIHGGRRADRPPVANPTSIACLDLMDKTGVYFPDAHLHATAMAELAAAGHEVLGFDAVMPEWSVQQEAAALGCDMDWGSPTMMPDARTHPARDLPEPIVPDDLDALLEAPPLRVVLDAIALLRREYGDRVAILGKVMGPWTISYHLAGTQDFLLWTITEPDRVTRFLDRLKHVTVAFANAQLRAGADVVTLADHATGDLVSPAMYRRFLQPVHREILARVGGPTILHVCGNCADRLTDFADSGFEGYHFEWQVDSRLAVETVGSRLSLVGNVSSADALFRGTPDDVYRQARYATEAGVRVLAPECAVALQTPLSNLRAIVEAAREGY
jgi:[methyl-Co(III) methanol-specific corrinoid protein]:coenzyme M methyltransferase